MNSRSQVLCGGALLLAFSLGLFPGTAYAGDLNAAISLNSQFTYSEWKQSNCEFPKLIGVSEKQLQYNYQVLESSVCAANHQTMLGYLQSPAFNQLTESKFPLYINLVKEQMLPLASQLSNSTLLTPAQIAGTRKDFSGPSYNPQNIEQSIRKRLGVDDGHAIDTNCAWKNQDGAITDAQKNLQVFSYWQTQLFSQGYDCTVSLFKSASAKLNAANGFADAQDQFNTQRQYLKDTPHQNISGKPLKGLNIAVFPQLGYDIPPIPAEHELLSYPTLSKGLKALGAHLYLLQRVSASTKEVQVQQSIEQFEAAIADLRNKGNDSPKFLVVTRSMGGMVAREVFERRPDLRKFVSGVILIGSTPHGSVVGDYKSRGDLFDDTYLQQQAPAVELLSFLAATPLDLILDLFGFNPDLAALHSAGEVRNNITSMSHLEFDPTKPSPAQEMAVMNIIQLPDSLGSYFLRSQRAAPVDPTFLLMSMYGPTEGSTPLSHAAWDTSKSTRVFVSDFNHLGFWSLQPDLAIDYWLAAIFTAKKFGLW